MVDAICSAVKCLAEPAIGFLKVAFGQVMSCEENMESLREEMAQLKTKRDSLQRRLDDAERESKTATEEVKLWLHKADELQVEAAKMNDAYSEMLKVRCLGDISPNVWASYTCSKNAVRLINSAKDSGNNIPHDIVIDLAPGHYLERLAGSMVGRDYELNKLQKLADEEEVSIIGIYGMGGVGKTALLDKFHNETPLKGTHLMIHIDMNGLHNVDDTQLAIFEKLALVVTEKENGEARACRITEYLNKKSFVLILDNVWKAVDLKVVGVPIGTRQMKSKVIVASRIESVCDSMNAKKTKIQVKCLEKEEAWSLFAEKAGKELIESNPIIRHHAEILVNKCGGLPLALINIGHAVAGKKTPELWQHVIMALENTPQEAPGMKDVFTCLKLSYDNLADDKLKICLLYCTLFPEGYDMCSYWIVDYCIGEGVLVDQFYAEDVYNEGYNLLDILKSASMLEPGRDPGEIKMHPMMRVSVIWIESGTDGGKCLIRAGKELAEAPDVDEWRGVERVSLMQNSISKLSEKPYSPRLLTLFLAVNPLMEICDGFFRSMKNLRVLDLSHTHIQEVPAEIGELVQLQYLDFCDTCIASLPQEVGNLIRLRYFLLSGIENLVSIPEGLIAKLTELRVLYMETSFEEWKVDSDGKGPNIEELHFLKRLKALGITINTLPALKKLAGSNRLAQCTRRLGIRHCPGLNSTLSTANIASNFKALEMLFLGECSDLEEFLIDDRDEWSSTLPHLTNLWLGELPKAKISWNSGCLQKLKYLTIEDCSNIRQLIHCTNESTEGKGEEEEWESESEREDEEDDEKGEENEEEEEDGDGVDDDDEEHEGGSREINVLPNLYSLELKNLPELESLSCGSRQLAFPSLEILDVYKCPKLKKLPLNAKRLQCISGQPSWWNRLAWPKKHNDTKSMFKSIFKAKYPSIGMSRGTSQSLGEKVVASGLVAADKGLPFEQLEQLVPNDDVRIIGIHGMGGVGKTRLLKTFFSQFPPRHKYQIVWIDMNGIHTVEEVQKAVAEKLGLHGHRNKSQEELARCIAMFLEEKDTILILDNVWKVVDLIGVGIPTAPHHAKSKVIMVTRLEDICDSMGAAKVEVKCLEWEAAWSLFEDKVGKKLIESHSLIQWHAEGMVRKCVGLPLALIAVGSAMSKKKTPEKWEDAMATLENVPQKVPGMTGVISRLKLSYDNIADDKLRACLMYCSMFPDDHDIPKKAVTNYGIGEGFLADDCLDALKHASMLGTSSNPDCVRIHPMIRVLALWVGGRKWLVRAGKELAEAPDVDAWMEVERISLMRNCIRTLSVRPESPFLLTLSLRENPLEKICNGFFQSMTYLRVLDLSETSIRSVPAEIGELKELLYLNLSGSPISSLPRELGNLIRLRFLGLSDTEFLKQVPEGLIASLAELQSLSMFASYNNWKVDSTGDGVDLEELYCLNLLKKLAISINTTVALLRLSRTPQLASSTHALEISQCKGLTALSTATLRSEFRALSSLGLRRCGDLENFVIDDGDDGQASPLQGLIAFKLPKGDSLQSLRRLQEEASTHPNLTALNLSELHKARITLKSGSLQSLRQLRIANCKSIRQLIHLEDESLEEDNEKKEISEEINILPNLYHLSLSGLPELDSLSCGRKPLAFPSLKVLGVQDCPKLRKLTLNPENLECIYGEVSWWKSLEWPENQGRILSKLQSIYVDKYPSSAV